MAAYTRCLRCAGAPKRPASGSGLSLLIPSWHAALSDPGEFDIDMFQNIDVDIGLRRMSTGSALPILPQSVSRGRSMALSLILGEAGLTAERMETTAEVTLDKVSDGFAITAVHLTLEAKIPGADDARFQELAAKAKAGCPVSKLLKADITLDASVTH